MDFDATLLKERIDTAVGAITPDVTGLVRSGTERGRVMRRRRRLQTGLGAAAVSVLAVAGVGYVVGTGPFDSDATGPADPGPSAVVQREPATPRGLAAAVMTHIDVAPAAVGGQENDETTSGSTGAESLFADLAYDLVGDRVELMAAVTPNPDAWSDMGCDAGASGLTGCRLFVLADGSPAMVGVLADAGSGAGDHFGYVVVAVKRDDQIVAVVETTPSAFAIDPETPTAQWDLPVDVAVLTEIASDPLVGLSTSADLNAAGEAIEGWQDGGLTTTSGSASSPGRVEASSSATVAPPESQPSGGGKTVSARKPVRPQTSSPR
ncbi:MAG: hypothetical protein H0T17_02940 [Propionibacteriales bacterium]|nr:hypothetical protein [Propionibacteriales bacterium]